MDSHRYVFLSSQILVTFDYHAGSSILLVRRATKLPFHHAGSRAACWPTGRLRPTVDTAGAMEVRRNVRRTSGYQPEEPSGVGGHSRGQNHRSIPWSAAFTPELASPLCREDRSSDELDCIVSRYILPPAELSTGLCSHAQALPSSEGAVHRQRTFESPHHPSNIRSMPRFPPPVCRRIAAFFFSLPSRLCL